MKRSIRKIAFVSPHCVMDFTNGERRPRSTRWPFCAVGIRVPGLLQLRMDAWEEILVEEVLAKRGMHYAVRNAQIGRYRGRMIFTSHGPVPVTLFNSASTRGGWIDRELRIAEAT